MSSAASPKIFNSICFEGSGESGWVENLFYALCK